jgi:Tol biopolymer transport system component/pimeloyl-ACP methyl ester carboxylesterase
MLVATTHTIQAASARQIPKANQNNLWYRPTDGPTVIVFVHGFLSDSRSCWMSDPIGPRHQAVYWPELVATDVTFGDSGIYLGGYYTEIDSGAYGIAHAADDLFRALTLKTANEPVVPFDKTNLIFVCHSMGGVVVRQMLVAHQAAFREKHVGLVLIASPSFGSKVANRLTWLAEYFRNEQGRTLSYDSANLKLLDYNFATLLATRAIPRFDGSEAAENHFIIHRRFLPDKTYLVTPESACVYFNSRRILPGTDHFTAVKPTDAKAQSHQLLQEFYNAYFLSEPPKQAPHSYASTVLLNKQRLGAVAVSRDGRFIAFVRIRKTWEHAVFLRQMTLGKEIEVAAPRDQRIVTVTFSPDGERIFYVASSRGKPNLGSVFDVPLFGGEPRLILEDVDSQVTFSPDGSQFIFIRNESRSGLSMLMRHELASRRTSTITTRKSPLYFSLATWSPDGKKIACVSGNNDVNRSQRVIEIDPATRGARPIGDQMWWTVTGLGYEDAHSLIIAADTDSGLSNRLWLLDVPTGTLQSMGAEAEDFRQISVSSDGRVIALTPQRGSSIVTVDNGGRGKTKPIPDTSDAGINGLAVLDANNLAVQCLKDGVRGICTMTMTGSGIQFLTDAKATAVHPARCGDEIAFTSFQGGKPGIWLMKRDGSGKVRVTGAQSGYFPACEPKAAWLAYVTFPGGPPQIEIVATDGGNARLSLAPKGGYYPAISPDGRSLACALPNSEPGSKWHIAIYRVQGGAEIRNWEIENSLDVPPRLRWTPDGTAVAYLADDGNGTNVWVRALKSGQEARITSFVDSDIYSFDFTPDSSRLVCAKGSDNVVLVLLTYAR